MPQTIDSPTKSLRDPARGSPHLGSFARQLVLGAAVIAAIVVGLKPAPASQLPGPVRLAQAQTTPRPAPPAPPATEGGAVQTAAPDSAKSGSPAAAGDEPKEVGKDDVNITIDESGIRINDARKKKRGTTGLGNANRDYDSFEEFIHQEPWVGAMVFGIVMIVFMVPVLIIGLVVWYKLRKTRMMNETMVKLAEHGVVPPNEAVSAIATGRVDATMKATMASAPVYEQAKLVRKSVAWSDLRKGVLMVAVGLSFAFYSMIADGEPNWLGLVLIFVGLAYSGLWFFESRAIDNALDKTSDRNSRPQPPAGGA